MLEIYHNYYINLSVFLAPTDRFIYKVSFLEDKMQCLKCGHKWKRTKWTEYISFFSKCPKCGSRFLMRY